MILDTSHTICIDRISNDCILSDNKFTKIYNFLIINGYEIIEDFSMSDIVILDLCWVNSEFLDQTSQKISLYLDLGKKIVLFWCISTVFKEKHGESLIYIDSKKTNEAEFYFEHKIWISSIGSLEFKNKITILETDSSLKNYKNILGNFDGIGFVSISDWCSLHCSYCNIKKIKWDTMSSPPEQILEEISREVANGKSTIYLLSDDCGSYGIDIWTNFADLLESILALDDTIKIHITNIYPLLFLKFYDRIKGYIFSNRIISMVLPLQHTSDRILSLMNRKYSIKKIIELLREIRKNSNIQIQNHIIFDYHDETLEEFVDTLRLLQLYDKNFYFRHSDVNKVYWKKDISNSLKEKITLLKKLQKKYNIDITL